MKSGKFAKVLKWVGYLTAIIGLFTGIRGVAKLVTDRAEASRKVNALLASEDLQLQGHDYRAAWQSLEEASHFDPDSPRIQSAQETLAMTWLDHISVTGDKKFSDIITKLEPVLSRGASAATPGPKKADLLAHVGWSYFLRSREGQSGLDPVGSYSKAVELDSANPYAHAMWGHWILWNDGKIGDAEQHFSSALSSKRETDYVRDLQLSALFNCNNEECDEGIIRMVNEMRKEQRAVNPEAATRIFSIYYTRLLGRAETRSFIHAVPPAEHLATFQWLFDKAELDDSKSLQRTYFLAALREANGQNSEALAAYRMIHSQIARNPGSLLAAVNAGIQRLSH